MTDQQQNDETTANEAGPDGSRKMQISGGQDLPDSAKDEEKMKSETVIMDLPDVEDIPGQENVRPAPFGEMADVTISSDDEEGAGIFDVDEDDEEGVFKMSAEENVSTSEKQVLENADSDMPGGDDERLRQAGLDNEDDDGTPLNEEGFGVDVIGDGLDISGADEDNANENLGEEDEENNLYSRGGGDETATEGLP